MLIELIQTIIDWSQEKRDGVKAEKIIKKLKKDSFKIDIIPVPNTYVGSKQETYNKYMAILNGVNNANADKDIMLTHEN